MTQTELSTIIRKSIPGTRLDYWSGINYYKVIANINGVDWDMGEVAARAVHDDRMPERLVAEFVAAMAARFADPFVNGYPSIHWRDDVLGMYLI